MTSTLAVDVHAHWVPRGLLKAREEGTEWYGWRSLTDKSGTPYLAFGEHVTRFDITNVGVTDPEARIKHRIEHDGVDCEALVLLGLLWNYHLEGEEARRFTREVNEELADVQAAYPRHYAAMGVLPAQDLNLALQELEHAVTNLGLRSFVIATNINGRNLDDPTVLPLLEAAAQADVAFTFHPPSWGRAGESRFPRYYFSNSFGAPLESSLAAMSAIYSGILDRHPALRLSFTQGGGWVPYGVGRFTLRYHQRTDACPMAQPPEEYLPRLYFDCLIHDVESLRLLATRVGTSQIMIGTDQHAGGDIPGGAAKWIRSLDFLSEDDKRKILRGNAEQFLRIPAVEPAGP